MSAAPYSRFRKIVRADDSAGDKLRKLIAVYRKARDPDDIDLDELSDADVAALADRLGIDRSDGDSADGRDDADTDDDIGDEVSGHSVSQLADLVSEASEGAVPRASALRWLLHSPRGHALARQHAKHLKKKEQTMTPEQTLRDYAKSHGAIGIAKYITDGNNVTLSEHEFVELVDGYAKANGTTFAKLFEATTEEGLLLRKAVQVLKRFPDVARDEAVQKQGSGSAYDVLMAKAEAIRAQDSSLSVAQAFSKAFSDPNNRELAAQEREQNRPRAG